MSHPGDALDEDLHGDTETSVTVSGANASAASRRNVAKSPGPRNCAAKLLGQLDVARRRPPASRRMQARSNAAITVRLSARERSRRRSAISSTTP